MCRYEVSENFNIGVRDLFSASANTIADNVTANDLKHKSKRNQETYVPWFQIGAHYQQNLL